jgi:succinate dehydrogenase flavin-adding protein (antitoxin of CptAB toxin-antitoxin module)
MTDPERLLDLSEPDLAEWLTRRQPVPSDQDSAMLRAMVDAAGR